MHAPIVVIVAILFFILTPGVLVSLPPGCDFYTVAAFHAITFAIIWMLIMKPLYRLFYGKEKKHHHHHHKK